MLVFVCRFSVQVSTDVTVVINIKERYVSRRVRASEFNGRVNIVKIIDEDF